MDMYVSECNDLNPIIELFRSTKREMAVQEMSRVIRHGIIILDLPNPHWAEQSREQLEKRFKWPDGEDRDYCFEEKVDQDTYRVYMHYFSHQEIRKVLAKAGITEYELYGDYLPDATFIPDDSRKCIIVARKS